MATPQTTDLERLNAQIVGHLLARRSPPRELLSQRERLRADLVSRDGGTQERRRFG